MKRKFTVVIFVSFIVILFLNSCSLRGARMIPRSFDNDQNIANARMDKVLEAIQNKDKDALKALFSPKAIAEAEEFDQSIIDLFDYFQGDFISYNDQSAINVEEGLNDDGTGRRWKALYSTYDLETSNQEYRIAIKDFTVDTANSNNVGIYSFYIIKLEDDPDPKIAYRGDDKYTPGINFNIKNVLPEESIIGN